MAPQTCNKRTLNQTIFEGIIASLAFLNDEFDENDRDGKNDRDVVFAQIAVSFRTLFSSVA